MEQEVIYWLFPLDSLTLLSLDLVHFIPSITLSLSHTHTGAYVRTHAHTHKHTMADRYSRNPDSHSRSPSVLDLCGGKKAVLPAPLAREGSFVNNQVFFCPPHFNVPIFMQGRWGRNNALHSGWVEHEGLPSRAEVRSIKVRSKSIDLFVWLPLARDKSKQHNSSFWSMDVSGRWKRLNFPV